MQHGGRMPFEVQFPRPLGGASGGIQDFEDIDDLLEESEPINGSDPLLQVPNDETDIFKAVRYDDLDMISRLLRQGIDINSLHQGEACNVCCRGLVNNAIRMTKYALLHVAVLQSPMKTVEFLVNNGADVNITDQSHRSPLHYAADVGRNDVINYLIKKGGNVNMQSASLKTPLMYAVAKGDPIAVKQLIKAGADPDLLDMKGTSALHLACFTIPVTPSLLNVVEILIKGGANVNIQNKKQATPLMMSINVRNADFVRLLLEAGADVNHEDCGKRTAFQFTIEANKSDDIALLLVQRGADVNSMDKNGDSPLEKAVRFGKMDVIRRLLLLDCHRDHDLLDGEKIRTLRQSYSFFNRFMEKELNEPWSLLRCCRYTIRNFVEPSRLCDLENLVIPRTLKDYLQFK